MSKCIAFDMKSAFDAWDHMKLETVENYGGRAYGHYLHTWDDGERILARCKNCGGYILIQSSEYHGMEDDDYYGDYFPVDSPEEADELNRKYDGWEIETEFPYRYLMTQNLCVIYWSK